MSDSRDAVSAAVATTLVLVTLFVLLAGGGTLFLWQRQAALREVAMMQRAEAEAANARAMAEQRVTQSAQADQGEPDQRNQFALDRQSIDDSVRAVLQSQQRAWNAGDIDQFMDYYWKSNDLTFSSGGKVTRTWQRTLENYKQRYPSRAEMGRLSFDNLEVTPLGQEAALVLGEWQLSRESDELGGNFSLVLRLLDDEWVIVHDHTSRAQNK